MAKTSTKSLPVSKPLKMKGVPAAVVAAENKRLKRYITNWTNALEAHLDRSEKPARPTKKRT